MTRVNPGAICVTVGGYHEAMTATPEVDVPDTSTIRNPATGAVAGKVHAPADLLAGYYQAVHAMTLDYITKVSAEDLEKVVDKRWTPAVTASARLVSVIDDCAQHLGAAAYVRGIGPA